MAEESDQDPSQKTEEPSHHRLQKAREKGQVAFSKDVLAFSVLAFFTLYFSAFGTYFFRYLKGRLSLLLENIHQSPLIAMDPIRHLFFFLMTFFFGLFLFVIAMGGAQTRFLVSLEKLKPKASHLSPLKGLERVLSKKALVEFLKSFGKFVMFGCLTAYGIASVFPQVSSIVFLTEKELYHTIVHLFLLLMGGGTIILFFIALFDYIHQWFMTRKELRMSKQEIKEEYKEQEGDPHIKGKIKQLRQSRLQESLEKATSKATVIITNPTHFAIGLRWVEGEMKAPQVVVKGMDFMALKIRELAKDQNIPIVENPPLARSLYDTLKIDQYIRPEHYKAVADVIRYVMRLKTPRPL